MDKDLKMELEEFIYDNFNGWPSDSKVAEYVRTLAPFIQSLLDRQKAEIIDYISLKEGWEETGDKYRKHFGLKPLYEKNETNICSKCTGINTFIYRFDYSAMHGLGGSIKNYYKKCRFCGHEENTTKGEYDEYGPIG